MQNTHCLFRLLSFVRPHRSRCCLLLPTEQRGLSVCLSVTVLSPAKAAEPTEMPFGLWTRVGRRKHVLHGSTWQYLAPPGEYDWTVRVRRWCGLMSNYVDHWLL